MSNYLNKNKKRRTRRFEKSEFKTRETIERLLPKAAKTTPKTILVERQILRE